jgi:hypothetical protein
LLSIVVEFLGRAVLVIGAENVDYDGDRHDVLHTGADLLQGAGPLFLQGGDVLLGGCAVDVLGKLHLGIVRDRLAAGGHQQCHARKENDGS